MTQKPEQHWCVVGAGVMGLTLAKRLAEAGQRVTLLESSPEIGGLASAWTLETSAGPLTWDRHYHVTLLSDLHTRQMLRELGLEEAMQWVETKTGFFTAGKLYSMSNSWEFLNFPPLRLWEKLRLGATIFAASKIRDGKPLEKILVADWLRKWSGRGTFEKIWRPLLQAKLGESYRRVSAAFIWATIARMYRARQSGLKKEMFGYLPGGYARVLAKYVEVLDELQVDLVCGSPVQSILRLPSGRIQVELVDGAADEFDQVVVTAPSAVAVELCPQLQPHEKQAHQRIEYLGILCASVVLKRALSPYYVTNITDQGVPFTAVIEMSALVDRKELAGNCLVYLPRYVAPEDPAWNWSDEQLQEEFLAALEKMYPGFSRSDVLCFQLSRVKHVMALPTLDYSAQLPAVSTSIPNLKIVNAAQIVKGTLNVNEVVEIAENSFREHLLPVIESFHRTNHSPSSTQANHAQEDRELVARSG